jgi:hypothetical protein
MVESGTDRAGRINFGKICINSCPMAIVSVYAPAQIRERQRFFRDPISSPRRLSEYSSEVISIVRRILRRIATNTVA